VFRERLPRFAPLERARGWHVQYNDLIEGASFVRDPRSLLRYDPETVRLDLFLRHREVERLEGLAAEREQLRSALEGLRHHLEAQNAELERLRPERERLLSEFEVLRRHLEVQNAELDRLRPQREQLLSAFEGLRYHLAAQNAELERLRPERERSLSDFESLRHNLQARGTELDALRAQLAASEATVARLLASRSWKLTAPLRAADRLLRGSPESR
jgi:chromosome segregation ATPase